MHAVFASLACLLTLLLALFLIAHRLRLHAAFSGMAEYLIVSIGIFTISINVIFDTVSLLPVATPIRVLGLPLTYVAMALLLVKTSITELKQSASFIGDGIAATWRRADKLSVVIGLLLLLVTGAWLFQGVLSVPTNTDGLTYHGPQAYGMFQEGRVRAFSAWPTWLRNYPQGAAALWAWSMLYTGSDLLFAAMQFLFFVQLAAAVWVLAAKLGADTKSQIVALLMVISMPVLYVLTYTINADLGYSAAMLSFIALLLPVAQDDDLASKRNRFIAACLLLAQAAMIKIPIMPIIYFGLVAAAFYWTEIKGKGIAGLSAILANRFSAIMLVVMAFAASTYVLNWIEFGNPFHPLAIEIGGVVVFRGDGLESIAHLIYAQTTFGPLESMNVLQRWHAVFADWFQHATENSFGGPGPVFMMIAITLALAELYNRLRKPSAWGFAFLLIFITSLVIPGAYLPRYSLAWLCLIAVFAASAYARVASLLPGLRIGILIFCSLGVYFQWQNLSGSISWEMEKAGANPLYVDRGRSVAEKVDIHPVLTPSHQMVAAIRDNVKANQTLYYSIKTFSTEMWNRDFSNKVKWFPESKQNNYYDFNRPHGDISAWLAVVAKDKPDWMLVYSRSGLADALYNVTPDLHYQVFMEDKTTGDEQHDRWNRVLLKKVDH